MQRFAGLFPLGLVTQKVELAVVLLSSIVYAHPKSFGAKQLSASNIPVAICS